MTPLPMTVETLLAEAVEPALALLPSAMTSPEAIVAMLAIAQQESGLRSRWQIIDANRPEKMGPARGLWQFERGGVAGVIRHSASRYWAASLCKQRGAAFESMAVWRALEIDDVLAAGIARLLLFTDAKRLPEVGAGDACWELYARTWRPGRPHRATWGKNYARAIGALSALA